MPVRAPAPLAPTSLPPQQVAPAPVASPSRPVGATELDQSRELQTLLETAFGYGSSEHLAWTELTDATISAETTTPHQIGLASAYCSVRRLYMDDHALLGGGWQGWMVQPRRDDGGTQVLACCTRYAQDSIHTFVSRSRYPIQDGGYAEAKEQARASLITALVRTGIMAADHVLQGSSSRAVLEASEEGSVLELPHLSPSLRPKSDPSLRRIDSSDRTLLTLLGSSPPLGQPPFTPSDSPSTSPRFGGVVLPPLAGARMMAKLELDHPESTGSPTDSDDDDGARTPTLGDRRWSLSLSQ